MNEEIYESDDNKFLDYIFYQFKDMKVKNLYTLQQKIKTLDLPFFEEIEKHSASCTIDCWDFLLNPTKRWEKTKKEDHESDEDYQHHLEIDHFFIRQENRLKDEFLSKNNMEKKEWTAFAKKASAMLSKCKSCDDIDGQQVCKNNCASYRWTLFSFANRDSIENDLFHTIFKPLTKYHTDLYKNNPLKLAKIYLKWKRKGYQEINVLDPFEGMNDFEDEE